MAGKIIIDTEHCKGCGLCIVVCPKKNIHVADVPNENGYFPAQFNGGDCTGCTMCAIICPEAVIEVFSNRDLVEIKETDRKTKKASLPKKQAKKLTAT